MRYDLINEEVLKFLQSLKVLTESDDETKEGLDLKKDILGKAILKKDIIDDQGQEMSAEVVEFEPLMDHLFMKFQIRCPPMKVQADLKLLLAISPTMPDFLLVQKLELALQDLDSCYVNLLRSIKQPQFKASLTV